MTGFGDARLLKIHFDGIIGDARKRIEEEALTVNVVVPAPEPCQCGHSRWLHYVTVPDRPEYACICTCRAFRP